MKTTKIKIMAMALFAALAWAVVASPEIQNVTARQRYPWNGKVDISFEVSGDLAEGLPVDKYPAISVSATDHAAGKDYVADESALSGDTGWEEGAHHVVWDLDAQGIVLKSDNVTFAVSYGDRYWLYCIVDLSSGSESASYPVAYTNEPPTGGFTNDEYKTTKLVLRRIDAGAFKMGGEYDVTLTKPYYMGVFEVTQKQYELVTSDNPSYYDEEGDKRPVEGISWEMLRGSSLGSKWPASDSVDPSSFMGMVQARTGVNLDLPTEAQWEYACRAGTTSLFNNGGDSEDDLKLLGRYNGNLDDEMGGSTDTHTEVGSYLPNAWGLYDMHGNVCEWCVDWQGSLSSGSDPKGATIGTRRVMRGGSWISNFNSCTSAFRAGDTVDWDEDYYGFRLSRALGECGAEICSGDSAAVVIDSRTGELRASSGDETLTYSSLWDGDGDATVTITQKIVLEAGEQVVVLTNDLAGTGECLWIAPYDYTNAFVLTHTTYKGDDIVSEETASFIVTGKNVHFAEDEVTVSVFSNKYDGAAHGIISVTSELPEFKVKYASSQEGPFGATSPVITNVGTLEVWYEIAALGRLTETNSATVTILPREVTLTSVSTNKVYDGTALVKDEVTAGGDGFVKDEGFVATCTGSQTVVGESGNVFSYELSDGTKAENYTVTTNYGTLAVSPKPLTAGMVTVTVEEGGFVYDGTAKEPTVTVADEAPAIVTTDDYEVAYAANTNAGETATVIITGKGNYTDAVTNYFAIAKAQVTKPSAPESKVYDGNNQTADIGDTDLYRVKTNAGGTDVGEYSVELALKDPDNYRWADGDSEPCELKWTILPASIEEEPTPYDGIYDGEGHGIAVDVTKPAEGAVVKYALDEAGPYSEEPVLFTNVTEAVTVWYTVEAANYVPVTNSSTVAISPRSLASDTVTITVEDGVLGETDPVVTVADEAPAVVTTDDYDVRFEGYGVGAVKVVVTGKGNYKDEVVTQTGMVVAGEGTVTPPKANAMKAKQKATWKAAAAKGSVFAHWEGDFVKSFNLSKNELRNPSLALTLPADFDPENFDPDGVQAVFISIDSDRLGVLEFSSSEDIEPNVDVSGLALVDDSESYVTASVSGLPTGLKFDAKTLAITGKPTKPGLYVVKVTAKNASGYQWAENLEMRVSDIEDERIDFTGLPKEGTVGTDYAGQVAVGEFKSMSASGLPTGLKFDAKTGAVKGKPTKGGYFTVSVSVTYADKTKATATCLMTVEPVPSVEPKRTEYYPLTTISSNPEMGTATGTGVYANGKKASISAKAAKNCVFAGWYRDAELKIPAEFASGDWKSASQSVVVPEVRYLFAKFVTVDEDAESITLSVADEELSSEPTFTLAWTNYCGVALNWPLAADALSQTTVKAAGLPSGVKLVQDKTTKAYSLAGVPTAASKVDKKTEALTPSKVKLTVTTAGKASQTYAIDWVILPLPAWAHGTFDGTEESGGLVQALTVSAAGKISGKIVRDDGTWTLTATSYDVVEVSEEDGSLAFVATVVGKSGKLSFASKMTVEEETLQREGDDTLYLRGVATGEGWTAWQNLWKTEPWKADAKPFAKASALTLYVVGDETSGYVIQEALPEGVSPYGTLTLKFDASGTAKATAKFVTGQDPKTKKDVVYSTNASSTLIPAAKPSDFGLALYFAPKAGKFDGFAADVSLTWDGSNFTVAAESP